MTDPAIQRSAIDEVKHGLEAERDVAEAAHRAAQTYAQSLEEKLAALQAHCDDWQTRSAKAFDLLKQNPSGWNRYTAGAANVLEGIPYSFEEEECHAPVSVQSCLDRSERAAHSAVAHQSNARHEATGDERGGDLRLPAVRSGAASHDADAAMTREGRRGLPDTQKQAGTEAAEPSSDQPPSTFGAWASHIVGGLTSKAESQVEWEIVEALNEAYQLGVAAQPDLTALRAALARYDAVRFSQHKAPARDAVLAARFRQLVKEQP